MDESPSLDLDITAVVIAYKSEERIVGAIKAIERALAHLDAEILIVDNASGDRTVELAENTLTRGRVIANTENLGYGHAANQAISEAKGKACLVLNDDAKIDPDSLDKLLAALDGKGVAVTGPRILSEDGLDMPAARLTFPGLGEERGRLGDLLTRANTNTTYPIAADEPTDVAWVLGACLLGDTKVLREIGGFNPAFFLYVEDTDLCRRAIELGYRVLTVPLATCIHTGSVSTTAAFSDEARIRRRADAREIFYRIWYRKPTRSLIHLRRAIGFRNQPFRIKYHLPKILADGGSLAGERLPPPLHVD